MNRESDIEHDTKLSWSTIKVRGDEAESFLQGQLSQDVATIGEQGAWALLLAPDSAVIAACYVRAHGGGYDVEVPRALVEAALTRLRRFLLRTRATLEVEPSDGGPFATLDEQIDASWPGVAEFAAGLAPHTFGRTFVEATVSFDKGCFTGQELVARLDARGASVPWRLVRVAGPDRETIDELLKSKGPEGPQGVTSWIVRDGRVVGLGIAHRTLMVSDLSGSEVSVAEVG